MVLSASSTYDRRGFDVGIQLCFVFMILSLGIGIFVQWQIGLGIFLFVGCCFITLEAVSKRPANGINEYMDWTMYQRGMMKQPRRPTMLCLGDSLIHGTISASITPEIPIKLASELGLEVPKYGKLFNDPIWVVNAGQNCITSHTILRERLHHALNVHPDYVVLMIGTNDVLAMYGKPILNKVICSINSLTKPEEQPSFKNYEHNIRQILQYIREASPKVIVGVCTLPPLGENLNSPSNQLIRQVNDILQKVVMEQQQNSEDHGRTSLIPVYDTFESILEKKQYGYKSLSIDYHIIVGTILNFIYQILNMLLPIQITWNMLTNNFPIKNVLLSDGVHLNESGCTVVVNLIVEWLQKNNITKMIAVKTLNSK